MSDDQKPARGRPRTMDPAQIVRVAMHAYQERDPSDVSLNAICALAGVSKPALYREFGGEDGFMRAVLDHYAAEVLSEIFTIVQSGAALDETLAALIRFACHDPVMATGCVFYKMRAGKHRLGQKTRDGIEAIEAAAAQAFAAFLESRRAAGDWSGPMSSAQLGQYLVDQTGLALTQRAAGADPARIEASMTLALSVIGRG